jgi:hypothetical protein
MVPLMGQTVLFDLIGEWCLVAQFEISFHGVFTSIRDHSGEENIAGQWMGPDGSRKGDLGYGPD